MLHTGELFMSVRDMYGTAGVLIIKQPLGGAAGAVNQGSWLRFAVIAESFITSACRESIVVKIGD